MKCVVLPKVVTMLSLVLAMVWVSCSRSDLSKEAKSIERTIKSEISVGESKADLVKYFHSQGWEPTFDKWSKAIVVGITVEEKNGLTVHMVIVHVFVDDGKVVNWDIKDAWKPRE